MHRRFLQTLLVLAIIFVASSYAAAHCEIPCGIYDDKMRITMIAEHITTIEKSMKQILKLESSKPLTHNQLVRWIMNKEDHANELQEIVTQYFMTQRIKVGTENYAKKLTLLHKMLISAMKCKQTTDLLHISTLRTLLREFNDLYFGAGH
jgi:nickel superoxide dismutase